MPTMLTTIIMDRRVTGNSPVYSYANDSKSKKNTKMAAI